MLTTATKKKIDSARDILVGKIPVPTSQVEQITLALIYKFMSDMDKRAKGLGDSSGFFANGYEKYSWNKLMDKALPARDRVLLYREALEKMSLNPHIPQLFRDVFRDASLPFNDPETLKLFLDVIDQFEYDHSEELGNAFEYLLQVMGSQGDAGQFRTPRHIIDFIVNVVEPSKNDKILDPACGTAGFLISAYNHIKKKGLSTDEMTKLSDNFVGYDISQDMQRLSLVNMYLHHFPNPHIYEYDTLTSEDRWSDDFDVILANPPFMTPKGGIRPHNRFSVPSTRAEVLFVDYIMEHLTTKGKAGVIVPEGIIFQNQNAYKSLRKMMVDGEYLWAVVSLPSGIFQPYSGVKTSILLFDKEIAKKTNHILFVNIQQDGFDLGAQRRPIVQNDLPLALEALTLYKKHVTSNGSYSISGWPEGEFAIDTYPNCEFISKKEIAKNGDYNLSSQRYVSNEISSEITGTWPMIELGEIVEVLDNKRKPISKSDRKFGKYPYYGATGIIDYVDNYIFDEKLLLVGEDGAKWGAGERTAFIANGEYWVNNHAHVLRVNKEKALDEYVESLLNYFDLNRYITGVTVPKLNQKRLLEIQFPIPPLSIQQKIVNEISQYQKIIDGAKQVIENYVPIFEISKDWPWVELDDVCESISDGDHQPPPKSNTGVPFITISNIQGESIDFSKTYFVSDKYYDEIKAHRKPKVGDILYTVTGSFGTPILIDFEKDFCFQRHIALIRPNSKINSNFLYFYLRSPKAFSQAEESATGVAQKTVSLKSLRQFRIPLPSQEIQQKIAAKIKAEQKLIKHNAEIISVFESKIKEKVLGISSE